MPLSEHEQRILEEIERRLAEEDPRLVESVSKASVATHALRRIRWAMFSFVLGFVLLLLFLVDMWFALAGFVVMLVSGLVVYHYARRLGDHPDPAGRLSVTSALARLADRLRRPRGGVG
jgi:positive regulator of sigma E activity